MHGNEKVLCNSSLSRTLIPRLIPFCSPLLFLSLTPFFLLLVSYIIAKETQRPFIFPLCFTVQILYWVFRSFFAIAVRV